jgi:hypothetical protein
MKLSDVVRIVDGTVLCGHDNLDRGSVSVSHPNLMSDCVTLLADDILLITGPFEQPGRSGPRRCRT